MLTQTGGNIFADIGKATKKVFGKKNVEKVVHGVEKGYKSVKKTRDKALHKLKDFVDGKTKFKPSNLLRVMAGATGVVAAASTFIQFVNLISTPTASAATAGLYGAATLAEQAGRGNQLPPKFANFVKKHPAKVKMIIEAVRKVGRGVQGQGKKLKLAVGATGYALYTIQLVIRWMSKFPDFLNI